MPRGRPKRSDVSTTSVIQAILNVADKVHLGNGNFPGKADVIWQSISKSVHNLFSPVAVYTIVLKNYHNIWQLLKVPSEVSNEGIVATADTDISSESNSLAEKANEELETSSSSGNAGDHRKFIITLSADEYKRMAPRETTYSNHEIGTTRGTRLYTIFEPRTWTHIINSHFFDITKLPCTLVFKSAKITASGSNYARIKGFCKECHSKFIGEIPQEPSQESIVSVNCIFVGNYLQNHKSKSKRFLSGYLRQEAVSKLLKEKQSASMYRRLEAHKNMTFEGIEPTSLPSLNVLRVAKSKEAQSTHINKDPIQSLCHAQDVPPYQGIIRDVGSRRFFVHYWSSSQIHVYRAYCNLNKHSKISIDATGSIVQRLRLHSGKRSGHLFLYEVTVNDPNSNKQYSVSNMISERHDANSIHYWLAEWIRSGAVIPSEAVTDMSGALMSAVIKTFTQFSSLTDYISECYKILFQNDSSTINIPKCFVRCDVAHTIKLISQWKSLKGQIRRTRQFYIRCMAQVLQCDNVSDIEYLLTAILTVAQSETEGDDIVRDQPTKADTCKKMLQRRIGTGMADHMELMGDNTDEIGDPVGTTRDLTVGIEEHVSNRNRFQTWVSEVASKAEIDGHQVGTTGNQQYLPAIVDDIVHISRLLPMWTAIMVPAFGHGKKTASSAPVESSFNDLKHRMFAHCHFPMRVDEFVFLHTKAIDGAMKLAAVPDQRPEREPDSTLSSTSLATDDPKEDEETKSSSGHVHSEGEMWQEPDIAMDQLSKFGCSFCAKGDIPGGAHKCLNCHIAVHPFPECSVGLGEDAEGYGEKRICVNCFNLNDSDRAATSELQQLENWRNQGLPPKKRKRKSYLEANSEWCIMDLSYSRPVIPIGLLKNGHRLMPTRLNKQLIQLSNTCAFDSILQIMCVTYCDSVSLKALMDKESLPLFQLAQNVVAQGVGKRVYNMRATLLTQLFPIEKLPSRMFRVNCLYPVVEVVKKLVKSFPTVTETATCDTASCPMKRRITEQGVYSIRCSASGIADLEGKLSTELNVEAIGTCLARLENTQGLSTELYEITPDTGIPQCTGIRRRTLTLSQYHLLIEVNADKRCDDIVNNTGDIASDLSDTVLTVQLTSIPTRIHIGNYVYWLRGVSGFIGNVNEGSAGHYVAFCRRHDSQWESYDDLQNKKNPISPNTNVNVALLYYAIC